MPSLKVHMDMNEGDITQKKNMDQRVLWIFLAMIATLYFHYNKMSPCVHFRYERSRSTHILWTLTRGSRASLKEMEGIKLGRCKFNIIHKTCQLFGKYNTVNITGRSTCQHPTWRITYVSAVTLGKKLRIYTVIIVYLYTRMLVWVYFVTSDD